MATCFGFINKLFSESARKQKHNRKHAHGRFKTDIFKLQFRKTNVCIVTLVSDFSDFRDVSK